MNYMYTCVVLFYVLLHVHDYVHLLLYAFTVMVNEDGTAIH